MEPLDQQSFNQTWRQAFEGAEQPPDPQLWAKIERQLPPQDRRRPLAWLWWAAACLLALLLAGGAGWWAGRTSGPEEGRSTPNNRPLAGQSAGLPSPAIAPFPGKKGTESQPRRNFPGKENTLQSLQDVRVASPPAQLRWRGEQSRISDPPPLHRSGVRGEATRNVSP